MLVTSDGLVRDEDNVDEVRWERFRRVAQEPRARAWLTIQADLGLAPNTVAAYGRALGLAIPPSVLQQVTDLIQ